MLDSRFMPRQSQRLAKGKSDWTGERDLAVIDMVRWVKFPVEGNRLLPWLTSTKVRDSPYRSNDSQRLRMQAAQDSNLP